MLVQLKDRKTIYLFEMACIHDTLLEEWQSEKAAKYDELAADLATQQRGFKYPAVHTQACACYCANHAAEGALCEPQDPQAASRLVTPRPPEGVLWRRSHSPAMKMKGDKLPCSSSVRPVVLSFVACPCIMMWS